MGASKVQRVVSARWYSSEAAIPAPEPWQSLRALESVISSATATLKVCFSERLAVTWEGGVTQSCATPTVLIIQGLQLYDPWVTMWASALCWSENATT